MKTSEAFGQGRQLAVSARILIAALISCSPLQLFAQAQLPDAPISITVSGTVMNSVTHEPIGRAMVYSQDSRYATFTDNSGRFELTLEVAPPPGSGNRDGLTFGPATVLLARKPGFLLEQGQDGHAWVRPNTKSVTLSLVPEALIVGQVQFPSSETANTAQVVLYRREVRDGLGRWERLNEARTRSDGEYRFAELRAGQYRVFTAETLDRDPLTTAPGAPVYGFPPRFYAEAHDFASSDVIELRAGHTFTANMLPDRQRYYDVKIPVAGLENPGYGLDVVVKAQGRRGPGFDLGYDPEQRSIRGSLPNGTYAVEASMQGPTAATGSTTITIANGPVLGQTLALAANPSIEVDVRAQLSSSDSSRVQGQQPPPTAYVTLQSADEFAEERGGGIAYQSQPGPQSQGGPMALQGVKPGKYWVQVQPNMSNVYAASVTSGLTDLQRLPLVVPVGASVPPIEVALRDDGGTIEATVEGISMLEGPGATGTPIYLWAIPTNGNSARMIGEWSNGKYRLQQTSPGDYRVIAFDSPQNFEWRNPEALRRYESMGQLVHVSAGETAQVTLKMTTSESQ